MKSGASTPTAESRVSSAEFTVVHEILPRFRDTDAMGHINNAVYVTYLEVARQAYWQALDDATDERDAKQRLKALVDDLHEAGYTAAAKCLADDLDALVAHLRYPTRHRRRWRSTDENVKGTAGVGVNDFGRWIGQGGCSQS